MSRTEKLLAGVAVVGAMLCGPARAGDVRFDPSVDLSAYRDGNVDNVARENTPDEVARLGLNLVLAVLKPASSWNFAYRPSREIYQDFSERNNTGHNASIRYARPGSERSSFNATLAYSRSPRQEFDPLSPDAAVTYTPRSTLESASLRLGGSVAAGRRSSVTWGVSGRMASQEDIRDPLTGTIVTDFEDSEAGGVTLGWSFKNSQRSSIGGTYSFDRIGYDTRASTTVHGAAFTQTLSVGRDGAFNYRIGVLQGTTAGESDLRANANASLRWSAGEHSLLAGGVRQSVSEGDGLSGATLDRGGYFSWVYSRPRGWGAGATLTYWDRGILNPPPGSVDPPSALTLADNVSFALGSRVRLGLFHVHRRQRDSAASNSFGLFMGWTILGERNRQ